MTDTDTTTRLAAEIGDRAVRPHWSGGTSNWTLAYVDTGAIVPGCWSAMTASFAARRAAREGYTVILTADPEPEPDSTGNPDCDAMGHDDERTGDNVSVCRRCGAELIDDDEDDEAAADIADCTCLHTCAEAPATACSLSGTWHVHPQDARGVTGPCPVHPDAPGDR